MALVHGSHSEIYMWGLQDYELMIGFKLVCQSSFIIYFKAVKLEEQDSNLYF